MSIPKDIVPPMFGNILRADQLNFSGGLSVVTTNKAIGTIVGFAVERKGLHSSAWRVGQPGDAF
jgi:hypothetical protein